jgi:hypothetical protein
MAHNFVAYFNPVTGVYAFSECTLCSAHAGTDQGNAPGLRAVPQPVTGNLPSKIALFSYHSECMN